MDSSKSKLLDKKTFLTGFVKFETKAAPLVPKGAVVEELEPPKLGGALNRTYQDIKDTFKKDLNIRDSRFYLSEMIANQLSVEEEEKRRFESRVREEVEKRLSIIKSEAYQEAFGKGEAEGKAKGYDEEKVRIAKELELLATGLIAIETAKERLGEQYERALLETAFKLSEAIVHHEISERPEGINHTISEILQRISKEDDVRIRLSSGDFDIITKAKAEVQKLGRTGRIQFDMDESLKRGDCVVESLSGEIASFIDDKIQSLKEKLMLKQGSADSEPKAG